MPNSSDVVAHTIGYAQQYNNLRADVLNSTSGHNHNGTDGKKIPLTGLSDVNSAGLADGDVPVWDAATSKWVMNHNLQSLLAYGVTWNESTDAYTRTGRLAGVAVGSSPGNSALSIQAAMKRCVVTDAGVVAYYLDPTNSALKADGSASDLTGTDGQVMVEIPAFYLRYGYAANVHTWEISQLPMAGFTLHPAFAKNGANVAARYIGAYEGVLYDVSASRYTNGVDQTAWSCTFLDADKSITAATRTAPFTGLQAGDKIVISGTVANNGTFTVATVAPTVITTVEVLTSETAAATAIATQRDWTATTGDKLSSVSGKKPITNGTRAQFRAVAKNRGTGWRQLDYDLLSATQLLYLVEYASFYSQSMIGAGITNVTGWDTYNAYNPIAPTGNTNAIGNATGNTAGSASAATEASKYLSYRGIENLFGHLWKFVDGININDNVPYVSNTDTQFADDTTTNYTALGVTLAAADGWQATLAQIARGFLPLTVGAGSTTKITDYYYKGAGWRMLFSGDYSSDGTAGGAFGCGAHGTSAYANRAAGGRLAY